MATAIGGELADWLDALGLSEHLADAGLPTFTRDGDGTPQWVDPATGAPMTEEQLAALDAKLHDQGEEPQHAVPLQLLQLARQAKVREHLRSTPVHSYDSLAELRGESVNATRFWVHKGSEQHRVLVVHAGADVLVPAFQFDAAGQPRVELTEVLPPLLAAGMDPWRAWGWLTMPAALLGGSVPEEAAADPEEVALVRHAAVRLAEKAAADAPTPKPPRGVCH